MRSSMPFGTMMMCAAVLQLAACSPEERDIAVPSAWRADHHMHLASVDICERMGECADRNEPPAVYAADAVAALDEAGVARGVVFSFAYAYGHESLGLDPSAVAEWTRRENEFTAAEVAQFPSRLVGFFSVDPLEESAPEEVRHWRGSRSLIGLKLHFAASGIDVRNEAHRERVAAVLRAAAAEGLPIVMHVGGGTFDDTDAELVIQTLLPAAGQSWVQIAHAGGGYPFEDGRHAGVLGVFADHIALDDPRTRHVLFDLAYVPAPEEDAETAAALVRAMRRIGLERFLFGSDFDVLTPAAEIAALQRLGLTPGELAALRHNCAPWVCPADRR